MIKPSSYKDAVLSQSACNLSGIVFSFARIMEDICKEAQENGHGTKWKNEHPICRLFAEQILHLTSGKDYNEACAECEEGANEQTTCI